MSDQERLSVTLTREYDAPIDLVFSAWTDPNHVSRWMKCDDAAIVECTSWEPKTGASFSTKMEMPGQWKVESTGRFLEVDPPHLLVYATDADPGMQMPQLEVRVELEVLSPTRTRLTLTHSGLPNDDMCGIVEGGWTHSLTTLESIVAVRN